jgi:hypothetical protein
MKYEYHEGVEAAERFNHGMRKLFQVSKTKAAKRHAKKKTTARKTSGKNKG